MRPHQLEEPPIVFDRNNTHVLSGPDDEGAAGAANHTYRIRGTI